jgi:hypothetical protein
MLATSISLPINVHPSQGMNESTTYSPNTNVMMSQLRIIQVVPAYILL